MYTQHIILDLEMNPVAKENKEVRRTLKREIIEIGAVKLNQKHEVVDRFRCLVKPQYNTRITSFITNLTGICTADISDAMVFEAAMYEFEKWIGYAEKTRIYSWSDSDLKQIQDECAYKAVNVPDNMKRWIDFQAVYPRIMGFEHDECQLALHTAAEHFGISMDKKHSHSALYDAEVTTELVIPVLTGEYRKQAEILRQARKEEKESSTFTLGDACCGVLQQLLQQMQPELEFAR